jgi:hypothetical protein
MHTVLIGEKKGTNWTSGRRFASSPGRQLINYTFLLHRFAVLHIPMLESYSNNLSL